MRTLRLASRNLLRAPRRTILTTVALIAGVGIFILGEGFLSGMSENVIVSAIEGTAGHVLARPENYPQQPGQHPIDVLLELSQETRAFLDQNTVAWTERTYFAPLAAAGSEALRVVAIGYDPARDPAVFPRTHWKVQGNYPAPEGHQISVGPRIARLLALAPGDRLVLQVRTHEGAINALEVTVSGVVTTQNAALDMMAIFVPAALVSELIAADRTTHLSVKLRDRDEAPAFASKLRAVLGKADVVTWEDETADLLRLQQIRRRALDLVMFILMALAAFGIANTILMAAHERVREIGTLRAMGMTEAGVLRLFLVEGALLGVLGSLLGALWGGALVAHWATTPIDFSEMFEKTARGGISMSALVYTRFDPGVIGAAIALGVVIAVVASIYPARMASRLSPAEAVRA